MQGKEMPTEAETAVYVGIDVCKDWLDVYLHSCGQPRSKKCGLRVPNDTGGLAELEGVLKTRDVKLVVVEATGKLHLLAYRTLHAAGFRVAAINPKRSRRFADACGQLAKTDQIDAYILALVGEALAPEPRAPAPRHLAELQELVLARQTLTQESVALENRIQATESEFLIREYLTRLAEIDVVKKRLGQEIKRILKEHADLMHRYKILTSIPGIGDIVATMLIGCLSELGEAGNKEIAALVGVAPFNCDSGERRGQRHIQGGRAHVRTMLYNSALAAIRHDAGFKAYYARFKAAGKPAKVIITAVMRKIAVLANTLIRENRLWTAEPPKPQTSA